MGFKFNPFTGNFDVVDGNAGGTVTSVTATAPIASTGGSAPVISINDSGVTAASYTNANITVDAKGRITAASNGSSALDLVSYSFFGGF